MSDHMNDQLGNGIRMVTGLLSHDTPLSSEELAALNGTIIERQGILPTSLDDLPKEVRDRLDPRSPLDSIQWPTVAPRGTRHASPPATDEFYLNA